jgi:site-specific DNA recombinase
MMDQLHTDNLDTIDTAPRGRPPRRASFSGWEQLLGLDGEAPPTGIVGAPEGDQAILYLRVSTQRQMNTAVDIDADGNSIATQREFCQKRCKRLRAPIVETFIEPGNSAQSIAKRPVFRELLRYVEDHPEVRYVVIYMRSRIFRNQTDAAITKRILATMGVKLISAKEEFGEGYMADAMEAITDIMNEVQVRQSGEDIRNKLLHKAKSGGTVGRAKLGYLNVRKDFDGRLVNTIDVDPVRAPFIRWAFETYSTGEYSMVRLQQALGEQGLATRASAKWRPAPVSRSQIGLILRDPYYIGMVRFKGQLYQGRHEPLITPELFERVQAVIDERVKRGQRDRVHNHFLRGMMYCGRCRDAGREHRLIYTEATNGSGQVYGYYLCRGRQDGVCELPLLAVPEVERAVANEVRRLDLPADFATEARNQVHRDLEHHQASEREVSKRLVQELKKLDAQEERLIDLASDGTLATPKLKQRLQQVKTQQAVVRQRLEQTDEQLQHGADVILSYVDLLSNPGNFYDNTNDVARRKLLTAFFSRLTIDDDDHEMTTQSDLRQAVQQIKSAAVEHEQGKRKGADLSTSASKSERSSDNFLVTCLSKVTLVAGAGLEPATSRLGRRRYRGFYRGTLRYYSPVIV